MRLTNDQELAFSRVREWLDDFDRPVFYLFGYAGTGKTTIAKMLVEEVKGLVLFAAFTGKAALVMNRNGMNASTLHSLVYVYNPPDRRRYREMTEAMEKLEGADRTAAERELRSYNEGGFMLNYESDLRRAKLLVVDECSMVNEQLRDDLLSFKVPLLVLGDPGQLPPIEGTGALNPEKPDIMMTEVMRQALDNPIIWMATETRQSRPVPFGEYGTSRVIDKAELKGSDVFSADQIIVGTNKTRRAVNTFFRDAYGLEGPYPKKDERLICLKNNKDHGLLNGLMGETQEDFEDLGEHVRVKVKMEDGGKEKSIRVHKAIFDEYQTPGIFEKMSYWDKRKAEQFDYAYAITCHKAQGSQWDSIVVNDEGFGRGNPDLRKCWLYTAITRAAESLTLVRKG